MAACAAAGRAPTPPAKRVLPERLGVLLSLPVVDALGLSVLPGEAAACMGRVTAGLRAAEDDFNTCRHTVATEASQSQPAAGEQLMQLGACMSGHG
jgi:hypothetical protein